MRFSSPGLSKLTRRLLSPPPPPPKWQLSIIRIVVNVKVILLTCKQVIFLLWIHDLMLI